MQMIERQFDATHANAVLNNPAVRPWVDAPDKGPIDLTAALGDERNICLMGEHGGVLLCRIVTGLYEVHSFVLPSGRGKWFQDFLREAQFWMFTATDCWEVVTRIARPHLSAKAAALKAGMVLDWSRDDHCQWRERPVPVDIYSLKLQDWINQAPQLMEIGRDFHDQLEREARKLGITQELHEDDPNHNRHVGASYSMCRAGQIGKGVAVYNRWAVASRHPPIEHVSNNPPTIRCDVGLLRLGPDGSIVGVCEES